jgi:hypothetical protein
MYHDSPSLGVIICCCLITAHPNVRA